VTSSTSDQAGDTLNKRIKAAQSDAVVFHEHRSAQLDDDTIGFGQYLASRSCGCRIRSNFGLGHNFPSREKLVYIS
jgi:hypothetical protein